MLIAASLHIPNIDFKLKVIPFYNSTLLLISAVGRSINSRPTGYIEVPNRCYLLGTSTTQVSIRI
jgi:hypothetical protein